MPAKPYVKTHTVLDYAFIAPAILLLFSFLCGLIPALFCSLNKLFFAYLSLSMFVLSIGFHIYTLVLWRRYRGMAPLAYALGQPATHFAVMAFAAVVSSTVSCDRLAASRIPPPLDTSEARGNLLYLNHLAEIVEHSGFEAPSK